MINEKFLVVTYVINLLKLTYDNLLTTVDAVTRPNIGTPALAKAKLAAIIAAAKAEPPLSRTVAYTSTWKFGNSC